MTKTSELGIFNRGDQSEIGTHDGKPLDNKYSLNTVDICPVGALTSKDFRFRQRVWYLKDQETLCNGCSTGCNVKVYFNKEGFFRVKPVFNEAVNGYWMCDEGRDVYKFANRDNRWTKALKRSPQGWEEMLPGAAAKDAAAVVKANAKTTALVLTGQYTQEEYEAVIALFAKEIGTQKIYHWLNNKGSLDAFDGLLLRGDRNPNTAGLLQVFAKNSINAPWSELENGLKNGSITTVIVAGPENQVWFPEMKTVIGLVAKAKNLIWMQSGKNADLESLSGNVWLIPMKSYVEKSGTFINFKGLAQTFKKVTTVVSEALNLTEAVSLLMGQNLMIKPSVNTFVETDRPDDRVVVEHRKKNEFVFRRGTL